MNLPDRIHPNPAGHQKISETVFKSLITHLPKLMTHIASIQKLVKLTTRGEEGGSALSIKPPS